MRIIFQAFLFVFTTSVLAQSQELQLGDLNFFLKKGQLLSTNDYRKYTIERRSVVGAGNTHYETEGNLLQSRLSYGVHKKLNLFLELGYQLDWEVRDTTNNTAHFNLDGFVNPALGTTYRWKSQEDDKLNIYSSLVAYINVQDEEKGHASSPTNSVDGNAAKARDVLEFNTSIGHKWNPKNEWIATGGILHNFSGESQQNYSSGRKNKVYEDASTNLYLKLAYQYRPIEQWMISPSIKSTYVGEQKMKFSNVVVRSNSYLMHDLDLALKYSVTKNFLVRLNYGQSLLPDYDGKSTEGTEIDVDTISQSKRYYGLGIDWLWN